MGADGGISWLIARDPRSRDKVCRMLAILDIYRDVDYKDETNEWLRRNDLGECAIIIPYGTDQFQRPDARDVLNILDDACSLPIDITFQNVVENLATMQQWELEYLDEFHQVMLRVCCDSTWYKHCYAWRANVMNGPPPDNDRTQSIMDGSKNIEELLPLNVAEWASEVYSMLTPGECHSVETWT